MKQKIMHNFSLKIISLLIALMVWLTIVNIEDPTISKNISGIAVEVINENAISEAGKCYVLGDTETVSIRVRGPKSVIDKVKETDFKAVADLSKYSITNAVPVEVKFSSNREFNAEPEIIYGETSSINIELDDFVTDSFKVGITTKGTVSDGYYISKDDISLNEKEIKISGPESLMKQVSNVSVEVDVSDIKEETTVLAVVKAYDAYGGLIESERMVFNKDTVTVTVRPLIEKEIPIKVVTVGKAKEHYRENNIKSTVETIKVAGTKDSVDAMGIISLQVDIDGKSKKFKKKFDLTKYISSTVKLTTKESEATVTVEFEKSMKKTIKFKANKIKFINVQTGLLNKFDKKKTLSITITGLEKDVKNLTYEEMVPYIDMKDLNVGTHKVKVMFENIGNIDIVKNAKLELTIENSEEAEIGNGDATDVPNSEESN